MPAINEPSRISADQLFDPARTSDENLATLIAHLSARVCANCGYSRENLPIETNCPECGREPVRGELLLYGYPVGGQEMIFGHSRRLRTAYGNSIGLTFLLVTVQAFISHNVRWVLSIETAFLGVLLLLYYWQKKSLRHPGPIQIRITGQSIQQIDRLKGPTEVDLLLASSTFTYLVTGLAVLGGVLAGILWQTNYGWFPLACLCMILLLLRARRETLKKWLPVSENAQADYGAKKSRAWEWSELKQCRMVTHKLSFQHFNIYSELRDSSVNARLTFMLQLPDASAKGIKGWIDQKMNYACHQQPDGK